MLSEKAIQEFKAIWKEEYGEEISNDFAVEKALNLLTFFDAVYRPIKKEWLQNKDKNSQ